MHARHQAFGFCFTAVVTQDETLLTQMQLVSCRVVYCAVASRYLLCVCRWKDINLNPGKCFIFFWTAEEEKKKVM